MNELIVLRDSIPDPRNGRDQITIVLCPDHGEALVMGHGVRLTTAVTDATVRETFIPWANIRCLSTLVPKPAPKPLALDRPLRLSGAPETSFARAESTPGAPPATVPEAVDRVAEVVAEEHGPIPMLEPAPLFADTERSGAPATSKRKRRRP